MEFPDGVEIVDVTLRDGLQSLETVYPTDLKLDILRRLIGRGPEAHRGHLLCTAGRRAAIGGR